MRKKSLVVFAVVVSLVFGLATVVTAGSIEASPPSGGVAVGTMVQLDVAPEYTIYYTTDGARPSASSNVYSEPILIEGNTYIRAMAIHNSNPEDTLPLYEGAFLTDVVFWLDAADTNVITVDDAGAVVTVVNKADHQHPLVAMRRGPIWVTDAINDRPVFRFMGEQSLVLDRYISEGLSDFTIFVVMQRTEEQAGGSNWQRLISSVRDPETREDNQGQNFQISSGTIVDSRPVTMILREVEDRFLGPITVGSSATGFVGWNGVHQGLQGDIAEIIVFEGFLDYLDELIIEDYLFFKWGVEVFE